MLPEVPLPAWEPLLGGADDRAFDAFLTKYSGLPSNQRIAGGGLLSIHDPLPSAVWSISSVFEEDRDEQEADLDRKALKALRAITLPRDALFALQLLGQGYLFRPHIRFNSEDWDAWPIHVLPDGEVYLICTQDCTHGIFANPHEATICVFGHALLDAFVRDLPHAFTRLVRKDGLPTFSLADPSSGG
jgi:hypothetical protein